METTIYARFKATAEKIRSEAFADALSILQSHEADKAYFGDVHAAKVRKHDGKIYYYVSEEAFEEMLKWKIIQEMAMQIVYNDSTKMNKKEYSVVEFLAGFRPNKEILQSLKKAYKGGFLADFLYNKEAHELAEKIEKEKTKLLTEVWGF